MLNVSLSPSMDEITTSVHKWPSTTKPWVVATALAGGGTLDSHVQTLCCDSGLEMACTLLASDLTVLNAQCFVVEQSSWAVREVEEVLIGLVGGASVVIFRDSQGRFFCPDAPELPPSQVTNLASACVISTPRLPSVMPPENSADSRRRSAIVKLLLDRNQAEKARPI